MKLSKKEADRMKQASKPADFCYKCNNTGKFVLKMYGITDITTNKTMMLEKDCECKNV